MPIRGQFQNAICLKGLKRIKDKVEMGGGEKLFSEYIMFPAICFFSIYFSRTDLTL